VATFQSGEAETFWRYIAGSLDRLMALVEELPESHLTWRPTAPMTNSILGLAGHTLGNAADNILGTLAGNVRARDREGEFRAGSRRELVEPWLPLRLAFEAALRQVTAEQLDTELEHPRRGKISGREVLIVVARHAAEHLGQAELTRDLAAVALENRT
jgi:hypothetical protein